MSQQGISHAAALKALGFGDGETPDLHEIKRRYRQLARQIHPDTNTRPDARERFAEIAIAYKQLRQAPHGSVHHEDGPTSDRRRQRPFGNSSVYPRPAPVAIDLGILEPGSWADQILVAVYAHRPEDPSDTALPQHDIDLDAPQRRFWIRTTVAPDPDGPPHILLAFEANVPQHTPSGVLHDEVRIAFGKNSVRIPIGVHVQRKPIVQATVATTGLTVSVTVDRTSLHDAEVATSWGDGTADSESTHTYRRGGAYEIVVTARNAIGDGTWQTRVQVEDPVIVRQRQKLLAEKQRLEESLVTVPGLVYGSMLLPGFYPFFFAIIFGAVEKAGVRLSPVLQTPSILFVLGVLYWSTILVTLPIVGLSNRNRARRIGGIDVQLRQLAAESTSSEGIG